MKYQPIRKTKGHTPAERYLRSLCDKTFLSLWSYPSVYRDQRTGPSGDGKEVCDLLVVFENDIIIFSDKRCVYPASSDPERNWSRWFKRAVREGANQVWGAERWIGSFPDRLFLDPMCTQPFPVALPKNPRFHLVVVAHDVARACAEALGGSGSLMLRTDMAGISNHTEPFTVGDLAAEKTFVHILDDTSLAILMKTLDTIADFVLYLQKKERLFRSGRLIFAAGEEELLAWYLKRVNATDEHDFVFPDMDGPIALGEGGWLAFESNPQRLAQVEHDRISYMWDALIETFNTHALKASQYLVTEGGFADSERILRFCAREPRVRRRMLANALHEMLEMTTPTQARRRVLLPSRPGDPHFVLVLFPYEANHTYDENREMRGKYLEACLMAVKVRWPDAQDIIGIATESDLETPSRSEDSAYLDAREWTPEMQAEGVRLRNELGLFVAPDVKYERVSEYPTTRLNGDLVYSVPKNPRNKPCPCESGKKYKNCHGK